MNELLKQCILDFKEATKEAIQNEKDARIARENHHQKYDEQTAIKQACDIAYNKRETANVLAARSRDRAESHLRSIINLMAESPDDKIDIDMLSRFSNLEK